MEKKRKEGNERRRRRRSYRECMVGDFSPPPLRPFLFSPLLFSREHLSELIIVVSSSFFYLLLCPMEKRKEKKTSETGTKERRETIC